MIEQVSHRQPHELRLSLGDAEAADQTARAVLNAAAIPDPDDARRLGEQLASAIGRGLGRPPLSAAARIVVSTELGEPTLGDTMIVHVAGRLLGRRIHLTWKTARGEQMTVALCPPGADPCR